MYYISLLHDLWGQNWQNHTFLVRHSSQQRVPNYPLLVSAPCCEQEHIFFRVNPSSVTPNNFAKVTCFFIDGSMSSVWHLLVIVWRHRPEVIRSVARMPDHRWMRLEWGSHYPWGGLGTPSGPNSADLQTSLVSSEFSVIGICNWYQIETEIYQDNTQTNL